MAGRAFEMFYTKLPPAGRYSRLDDMIQREVRCGLQAVMAALDRPWSLARRAEDEVMPEVAQAFWTQLHCARYPDAVATRVLFKYRRTEAKLACLAMRARTLGTLEKPKLHNLVTTASSNISKVDSCFNLYVLRDAM